MSATDVIEYFNRYTGRLEQEQVYGAAWMRWTYGTSLGRLALETFVKRPFFSRWYGWRMDRRGAIISSLMPMSNEISDTKSLLPISCRAQSDYR